MVLERIVLVDPNQAKDAGFVGTLRRLVEEEGVRGEIRPFQRSMPSEDELRSASMVIIFPAKGVLRYYNALAASITAEIVEVGADATPAQSIYDYGHLERLVASHGNFGDSRYDARGKAHSPHMQVKVDGLWMPACGEQAHSGSRARSYSGDRPENLCGYCDRALSLIRGGRELSRFNPEFTPIADARAIAWVDGLGFRVPPELVGSAKQEYRRRGLPWPDVSISHDSSPLLRAKYSHQGTYDLPFQPTQGKLF